MFLLLEKKKLHSSTWFIFLLLLLIKISHMLILPCMDWPPGEFASHSRQHPTWFWPSRAHRWTVLEQFIGRLYEMRKYGYISVKSLQMLSYCLIHYSNSDFVWTSSIFYHSAIQLEPVSISQLKTDMLSIAEVTHANSLKS